MERETLCRLGKVVPLVLVCVGLNDCGGKTTTTTVFAPPTAIAVKRYLPGGTLDAGFGGSGAVVTKIDPSEFEYALAVARQTDGKIIAVGHSIINGQGAIALVRYNPDSSLDAANFGSNGIVRTAIGSDSAEAVAVAVQTDGKIVVAGTLLASNFSGKGIALLRYKPDGTLDTSFGTPGTGIVTAAIGTGSDTAAAALALQPADGKIVVAGHAFTSTKTDIVLLRYDRSGVLDPSFGSGGLVTTSLSTDAAALAIQLQSDGKIVAAGSVGNFSNFSMDSVLLRYNTDGTLDTTTFGVNGIVTTDIGSGNNFANAIVLQPADNKILVAGHANVDFSADTCDVALLRYNPNGTLDTTSFGGGQGMVVTNLGGFDSAFSVALQPDSKIVVSGNTDSAGSVTRVAVLRYDANGALDPAFGTSGIVTTSATGPSTIASGNAVLVQPDGGIVVAGYD